MTMLPGTMSRAEKGRIARPPRLPPNAQAVADTVAALAGVTAQAHWEIGSQTVVDGTDFYVGDEELGHIHLDGEAHIPLGCALADLVIGARLARRFRWSREFVVVDTAAGDPARWLFGLRRAQIAGAALDELAALVRARRACR
jgi:Family of unknown function (DUF5519)